VTLTLEQRLLRFLAREERDEQRALRELRAQPVDLRVLEGECIQGARYRGEASGGYVFDVADNAAKFRSGDPIVVGDGLDLEAGVALAYGGYDANTGELRCEPDPFQKPDRSLEPGRVYVIDRRPLGLQGRLRDAVRAAFASPWIASVLAGEHVVQRDEGRYARARQLLEQSALNPAQVEAGALAIATESLSLVQGPPGTGKTRLLAEVVAALCARTCRVALCAFTHRGVDNALLALRRLAPKLPLIKLSSSSADGVMQLRAADVQVVDARRVRLPEKGCVVAGTCYQLAKLADGEEFHYTVFDEAGQLPIPHALPGMLRARRWLFFGDHQQLPPVVSTAHVDREAATSVFEHLHTRYGSTLLDTTYRMNDGVCRVVSETFYAGRLHPADGVGARRLPFVPGGRLFGIEHFVEPVVWLRVDHQQPGQRSHEEAHAVADVVDDLVRQHGLDPAAIAVIAPFRAQVRAIRTALQQKGLPGLEALTIDTVERIQGQERDAVVVSLTAGDAAESRGRGAFHLSLPRLNVALSRARLKAVLVASEHAFRALPHDADGLRSASLCRELRRRMKCVDLTKLYVTGYPTAQPTAPAAR
jgi:DNA replication ATP-dependent helicase Dna2